MERCLTAPLRILDVGRNLAAAGKETEFPWEHGLGHLCHELWYVWRGEGRVRFDGGAWTSIRGGSLVWFRPGRYHEVRQHSARPLGVNFVHFDIRPARGCHAFAHGEGLPLAVEADDPALAESLSRRLGELFWESYHQALLTGSAGSAAAPHPRFRREPEAVRRDAFMPLPMRIDAPDELADPLEQARALALLRGLIGEFLHLARVRPQLPGGTGLDRYQRGLVGAVVARVQENLAAAPTVREMAHSCGYSLDHFGRIFRKILNCTPQEFVVRERLRQARHLLVASDLSAKQIAAHLGYGSPFFFSRQFKALVGMSPSAYRRLAAGAAR